MSIKVSILPTSKFRKETFAVEIRVASGSMSTPYEGKPSSEASSKVVPLPTKGSRIPVAVG